MSATLDISQFDYELPDDLIALYPSKERTRSRLLIADGSADGFAQMEFSEIGSLLRENDLLVCNDTRVIPARLKAVKLTGGRVEILVERIVDRKTIWAQAKCSRPLRIGDQVVIENGPRLTLGARRRDLFVFAADGDQDVREVIERCGKIPLPPYIRREVNREDTVRYQTVYARNPGSVAAPTAGLHFSENLLEKLGENGIEVEFLTLHVGAGTFAPVRDGNLHNHELHAERYEIPHRICEKIQHCKNSNGRVIAVGTTVVRALEHAVRKDALPRPSIGETCLFIKPGFRFKVVDALITNFHLPRSTLLMLVCAFGGTSRVLAAYQHAVSEGFRFYSYGDAMYITPEG